MSAKSARKRISVRPRVKLWLESDDESVLCGGLTAMLRAIDETGSIKHAAERVGRSYRFVWARIKEAEQALGHKLVESQIGGHGVNRSELTELARDLMADFSDLREEVFHLVDDVFAQRLTETLSRHQSAK